MSQHTRNHMNKLSANLDLQSAHFGIEQQCSHFNPSNLGLRNHVDCCSGNIENRLHSHDFSASLEQGNLANNYCPNLEQSTLLNASCCQPLKYQGRHGEPLYKSLLRSRPCSLPPYMDYTEGTHHFHHHECTFEAESSAVGNCVPHQLTSCNVLRSRFPALQEITLYKWYLIRSSGPHASEIAVGGFLSSRGIDNERIETATIVKRLEERKLLTKDGNVVNLVGPINDYRTVSNGFSLQTVHLFISGFPHIWNLVVGMGLPVQGAETHTASRSCDVNGGEVTSQVSLQRDLQFQGKCMHPSSVLEGRENEMASCLEVERHHRFEFSSKEIPAVEILANVPETDVQKELEEHAATLLDGEAQSSGDHPPSIVQAHEKQDKCIGPVRTEFNKGTELAWDLIKERSHDEVFHGQTECTANQMDAISPPCEPENMSLKHVETAMAESRSESMKLELVTNVSLENNFEEEKGGDQAVVKAGADMDKPLDLQDNAGMLEASKEKSENACVQSPAASDCYTQSKIAKISKCLPSSSRKRKVTFRTPDDTESEEPSSTSLSLETCKKGQGQSRSLNSKVSEPVSSRDSDDLEKSMVNKTVAATQKVQRKKKPRFLLPKFKRSTKRKVKVNIDRNREDGDGEPEACNQEGVEAGCKRRKTMASIINSADEQRGAILSTEEPFSTNKAVEGGLANVTALLLEPIIETRVEAKQGIHDMPPVKEAAPKKIIAKKGRGCLAKLQRAVKNSRVYDDSSQMESNDIDICTVAIKKAEAKIKERKIVDKRIRKKEEADVNTHLGASKRRKAKSLKKETDDVEDGMETSEGYCNMEAPTTGCDSGPLSTRASLARKRSKKSLLPPLPLPLVSVSKELVSKAFGLKTSKSGRLLVPALAHWRGQSLVRDKDGGIIAIEDKSQGATSEDTGCFTFKPPIEAGAKKLQKWLCETATELKCSRKGSKQKQKRISLSRAH